MRDSVGDPACVLEHWMCVLGTLRAAWLRCISRSSQMLSVICHKGSGWVTMGENENNLGPTQHRTTVSPQWYEKSLKEKKKAKGNYVYCGCFMVRVICWEFFVLAIKIKCNDFGDKNTFSTHARHRQGVKVSWTVQLKHTFLMYNWNWLIYNITSTIISRS